MLNPSDVYVTGGSDKLLVCWTDKVTKYDASSFYNWEQDNLPLHDLDERTQLAWEKFGHPTSALTGMSYVVSADASDSCSPLYFTTLSACVAALPEVINYPILVEVASFGNLGGLEISNKSFGPSGSLEIINRNSSFGSPLTVSGAGNNRISVATLDSAYTDYSLVSSISNGNTASMAAALTAGSACPLLANDAQNARLLTRGSNGEELFISSGVSPSSYADARFVNPYVFCKRTDIDTPATFPSLGRLTASLSSTTAPWDIAATSVTVASRFAFAPFDKTRTVEKDNYDVSTVNHLTGTELKWGTLATNTPMTSFAYFNSLDYIKVNNCNGPLYIRNFNVDSQHGKERGIEIKNSKVNLERCSVSRANKAGLYADSSEVNLLRGFVAFRNYELINLVRTGVPFAVKRDNYASQDSYGAGIYAVNSTVNLESTYARDIEKSTQASGAAYYTSWAGAAGVSGTPLPSLEAIYCLSRNDIGIHAVNSNIIGGRTELGGVSTKSWNDAISLTSELNTEAGIRLENSEVDYSGRLLLDGNYFGLDSANSKVYVDTVAARFNQATGYKFVNSEFVYNKDLYAGYFRSQNQKIGIETHLLSQVLGVRNNKDIECYNSVIAPLYVSSMPSIYQAVYTASSFGKSQNSEETDGNVLLPSIDATNNSNVDLIHAHIDRSKVEDDSPGDLDACYGAMLRATDNSTITCRGSHHYANVLLGPGDRDQSHKLAAAYAGNNSQILFQGPTTIAQAGIDALAERNSTIDFGPHRNSENELLVSSFDLSSQGGNHSMIELHSVRACLVANENSQIKMTDLGNYEGLYGNSPSVSGRTDTYTYQLNDQKAGCVSNGWMQLYPNANLDRGGNVIPYAPANLPAKGSAARYRFASEGSLLKYYYLNPYASLDAAASAVTTGGMSVRAIGDSLVEATNVHFPCGWANCSAVAYDFDGADPLPGPICSRLHIWNIADTSFLKASYISVSGTHPVDAAYHGPSGTWGNWNYGAPSTTPDTSGLSILDYYGVNTVDPVLGRPTIQNVGPFRLYFSIDPAAKFLGASSSSLSGLVPQVFSQGYSFSGAVSAIENAFYGASANYTSLLRQIIVKDVGVTPNWAASGFYYPSEIVSNPDTILVSVDDSGANAFANAKHNSVDKSLIGKRVNIFFPTKGFGGDSDAASTYGQGLLSVNNFDLKKDN